MLRNFTLLAAVLLVSLNSVGQCSTTDATSCQCEHAGQTQCDLLPDIHVARSMLLDPNERTEYPQTGAGNYNGQLRVSVSSPNIGLGPLEVHTVNDSGYREIVCGQDTFMFHDPFHAQNFICPNGEEGKEVIYQRIFHKNGSSMTYTDRRAGSMTYHPGHGHMHVNDWGTYSLHLIDTTESDPRKWPMVGTGAKLAFCLMDYGSCSYYNGHCVNDSGQVMLNGNFPNYGLGGMAYSCSVLKQGISSGWTDIYHQYLDGMYLDIPPGTCNGTYALVVELDPNNNFIESNESNNLEWVSIQLTNQSPPTNSGLPILYNGPTSICAGDSVYLETIGAYSYAWNTGETTKGIWVKQSGDYVVQTESPCGIGSSDTVHIQFYPSITAPVLQSVDTIYTGNGGTATAIVQSSLGTKTKWYDPINQALVHTGDTFTSPTLYVSKTYEAVAIDLLNPPHTQTVPGPSIQTSTGTMYTGQNFLYFNAHEDLVLESVDVHAYQSGIRVFELVNASGSVVKSASIHLNPGKHVVSLNFEVSKGSNYSLRLSQSAGYITNLHGEYPGLGNLPQKIRGLITITNSSTGPDDYYYFYNWKVKPKYSGCTSEPTPVEFHVKYGLGNESSLEDWPGVLFPNPSTGHFGFTAGQLSGTVRVLSMTGQNIETRSFEAHEEVKMNLGHMASGLYLIEFTTRNGQMYRRLVLD